MRLAVLLLLAGTVHGATVEPGQAYTNTTTNTQAVVDRPFIDGYEMALVRAALVPIMSNKIVHLSNFIAVKDERIAFAQSQVTNADRRAARAEKGAKETKAVAVVVVTAVVAAVVAGAIKILTGTQK